MIDEAVLLFLNKNTEKSLSFDGGVSMNKRIKTRAVAEIVVLLILLAMCSTDIRLRLAVFTYSPKSAVTMKYKKADDRSAGKDLYVITENVPVEKATQGMLETWEVYHFGPLKFAHYYGEC